MILTNGRQRYIVMSFLIDWLYIEWSLDIATTDSRAVASN